MIQERNETKNSDELERMIGSLSESDDDEPKINSSSPMKNNKTPTKTDVEDSNDYNPGKDLNLKTALIHTLAGGLY